jgi:hypothetical protein
VASCLETTHSDSIRELQMRVLGKSTYDYVIDYLSKKRLYPPMPFVRNADDWFRYSWLFIANTEPVINWVGKQIRELIDLGVPPDEITLTGKWVFDVKARKGSRWVRVAYKDPVVSAGLPYWVGFQQITNTSGVVWGCPANPPKSWTTGGLCTTCCVSNNLLGIYFAGGGKPPSSIQAGVGTNCCYTAVGYNMNSPTSSFNNTVDSTGTKNISTWAITGTTTVSISGPYLILIISNQTNCSSYGITIQCCPYANCYCGNCGSQNACGCSGYPNVVFEVIYENLGTLSIASSTSISASAQLIITLASPG